MPASVDSKKGRVLRSEQIIIVDDDAFARELYSDLLTQDGYLVTTASNGDDAIRFLQRNPCHLVITDLLMPGMDGLEVLSQVKGVSPSTDVIILTGNASIDSAIRVLKSGAYDYLTKPVNPEEFKVVVRKCLDQQRLFEENQEFKEYLNLFATCQRISACLDPEKLNTMVLESMISEMSRSRGVLVHCREQDPATLIVRNSKGLSALTEDDLAAMIAAAVSGDMLARFRRVGVVSLDAAKPRHPLLSDIASILVTPLFVEERPFGAVLLFQAMKEKEFSQQDVTRADFLAKQFSLSFHNANKYLEAKELAYVDDLTKLYNTRYLDFALDREIRRCDRFKSVFSVLFIDLDHFKAVNDNHGHLVGSQLLVEVAEVIQRCVREIDTVVRYGGDEYTILLVNTDVVGARYVAERIRKAIEQGPYAVLEGLDVKISACIGVAAYPEHASSATAIINLADKAMYQGKRGSRNSVYIAAETES